MQYGKLWKHAVAGSWQFSTVEGQSLVLKPRKLLVVIGSAKSGTTALCRQLASRPDMVLGHEKEPRFFTDFAQRSWTGPAGEGFASTLITHPESYLANFGSLRDDQWAIDGSTDYIWCAQTPSRLADYAADCELRVIAIVRDPLDRAVSEYNHTLRHGWEDLPFSETLDAEEQRMKEGWHPLFYHQRRSTVCRDLHRFQDTFGDRLLVLDYTDLREAEATLRQISAFLGVPHIPTEKIAQQNRSYLPRNALAKKLVGSRMVSAIGHAVVPRPMRRAIWNRLHTNARNIQTVEPSEIGKLRDLLAGEIEACLASSLIPTASWSA